jgi:hypothetical protein
MSEKYPQLEGIPVVLYTALWQVREMGFLKTILDELKIKKLRILLFVEDYKPGALISIDGDKGDYEVIPVDDIEGIEYDGAIIGRAKPFYHLINERHLIRKAFWILLTRKIILKGKRKLWKFLRLVMRCI